MPTVCIDPGHGGTDPGACAFNRTESADVLKLAKKVRDYLVSQGVKVIMTRTDDSDISINDRCKMANDAVCSYFLSLHRNSASSSARGYEIWVHSQATTETINKAKKILTAVVDVNKSVNRGVKKGAVNYENYGVNTKTKMPSALFEVGFISNKQDNAEYDSDIDKIAEAIAKSICDIVKVAYKKDSVINVNKNTTTTSKKSVDAVAKEVIEGKWGNGEARKKALTKAGYNYSTVQKRVNELLQ